MGQNSINLSSRLEGKKIKFKNITDRGSTYGELKQVSKLSYLKTFHCYKTCSFFQAPIRAEPTSLPNPMASSPPGLGLMGKAVFIHNGSLFWSAQGPRMVKPHSWKGGTPWPAIGAGSQQRTLSIKTLRFFVKSLPLNWQSF